MMDDNNIARVDGVAYIRCQCEKCGKWGAMAMPTNNIWDRTISRLTAERDEALGRGRIFEDGYASACQTVADMHAAAVGEIRGPDLGVVEDVGALKAERDAALEKGAEHRALYVARTRELDAAQCEVKDALSERNEAVRALESMTTQRNRGLEFGWNRGVREFAIWRDGEQLVGCQERPLKSALRLNPFLPDDAKGGGDE